MYALYLVVRLPEHTKMIDLNVSFHSGLSEGHVSFTASSKDTILEVLKGRICKRLFVCADGQMPRLICPKRLIGNAAHMFSWPTSWGTACETEPPNERRKVAG